MQLGMEITMVNEQIASYIKSKGIFGYCNLVIGHYL